jgi:hypothetical protein
VRDLRSRLAGVLSASGYPRMESDDDRLARLLVKLEFLEDTDRYSRLLRDLLSANDQDNFRSLVLEIIFAYQFESAGMQLHYEVNRRSDDNTTVDFLYEMERVQSICIEMRLVQQTQYLTNNIDEQLRQSSSFQLTVDGIGDRGATLRLQQLIFEKAVNPRTGKVIKFNPKDTSTYNIVAIEVSALHLGMIDDVDCILATYGDPLVPDYARRGLFGLLQKPCAEYADYIQEVAARFASFRSTVHAVLFLKQVPPTHPIDYCLEYLLIPNRRLMAPTESEQIAGDCRRAMNLWESVRKKRSDDDTSE